MARVARVACCHTSFVGVYTLLALSEDLDKDGLGSLVALQVRDPGADIDLEAALGSGSHFFRDSPSAFVYLDILGRGTFGVEGHHVDFLGHDAADPLALHDVVDHNDLFESPDTFSGPVALFDQNLVVRPPFEHLDVLKDLVLTGLGVVVWHPVPDEVVCHPLLSGHIVLSWPDHSVGPACLAFLVFFGHSQVVEVLCSDLAPSVSGQACSVHPLVLRPGPD